MTSKEKKNINYIQEWIDIHFYNNPILYNCKYIKDFEIPNPDISNVYYHKPLMYLSIFYSLPIYDLITKYKDKIYYKDFVEMKFCLPNVFFNNYRFYINCTSF